MTYFSNGTEGDLWEDHNCPGCVHHQAEAGCPVLVAHLIGNHDQHGEDPKAKVVKDVLDTLIPREGVYSGPCSMRVPVDGREAQAAMVLAQEELVIKTREAGWLRRRLDNAEAEDRAAELAQAGEDPGDIPITLRQLQDSQARWSQLRHTEEARRNHSARLHHLQEELGELARVDRWEADDLDGRLDRAAMDHSRRDAIGDVAILLAAYCTARGLDLEAAVHQAIRVIRERPELEPRPSLPASWIKGSNPASTPEAGGDRAEAGPRGDGEVDGGDGDGGRGGWADVVRSLSVDADGDDGEG